MRLHILKYSLASPCKTMQNHMEITSKTLVWIRSVRNLLVKSRDLDMSGPAKASPGVPGGDKSLSADKAFPFFFLSEM